LSEFISIIDKMNFNWLKIKHNHIEETLNFPLHHRDPFDRMLIAQAKAENLTIITKDETHMVKFFNTHEHD